MQRKSTWGVYGLCIMASVAFGLATARADVVLLDEHWSPEIVADDVVATEVDTEQSGDPTQAIAGYFSALLQNDFGAPNVRFRNAASLRPGDLPPDETEVSLWYRTDNWEGRLALDIWLYVPSVGRPVQVLQCELYCGGEDGRLVADDQWHRATGMLTRGSEHDAAEGMTAPAAAYIWLRPRDAWDVSHRTYIDRIEASVIGSPDEGIVAHRPARHVRPSPGAQMNGPGFILFEGEDVTGDPFPPGSAYLPDNADEQRLLSNGAWHQGAGVAGARAAWQFEVAEPGDYDLWARGFWYRGDWRWRVDGGEWHVSARDRSLFSVVDYRDIDKEAWGQPAITIAWTPLGLVRLAAGKHTLEIEAGEEALGFGFDCWVLARNAFVPGEQPPNVVAPPAGVPGPESVVLLDEYWLPEILQSDVAVTEIDTEHTGGPMQAAAGCRSALIENVSGAPSVRFQGAANVARGALPPGQTEARLWYRTDAWAGTWTLEVFVHSTQAGRPVRALVASLDGGGEGGRLIADDNWHQARGLLVEGDEYDQLTQDIHPRACYVWLQPTEGWDVPHRTYVDRIEAVVLDGAGAEELPPPPARRTTASPGVQADGPGCIWWEAEDSRDYPGPPSDVFIPRDADAQRVLSNGTWVNKSRKTDLEPLHYGVAVTEAGVYALWARGYWKKGSFQWRWDDGEWTRAAPDMNTSHWAMLQINWLPVGWFHLGEVELSAGRHEFEVEMLEAPQGLGFDCWVLARTAFVPSADAGNGERPE